MSQLKLFGKEVRRGDFPFVSGEFRWIITKTMGLGEDFKRSIFQQHILYNRYIYIYIQQVAILCIYYIYISYNNCVAKHQRFELCNVLCGSLWWLCCCRQVGGWVINLLGLITRWEILWQRMCLWVLVVTYSFSLVPACWMVVSMISAWLSAVCKPPQPKGALVGWIWLCLAQTRDHRFLLMPCWNMAQQREIFLAIFLACVARVRSESSCLVQLPSDSARAIGALGSPFSRQQKQCIDDYVSNVKTVLPNYTLEGRSFGGKIGGEPLQHPPILGAGFGCLTETWVELGSTSLDPSYLRVKKGEGNGHV